MAEGSFTARSRLEMGRRLVAELRARVERQRRFIEDLAASQHCDHVIQDAAESLRQMTANLHVMLESMRRMTEVVSADVAAD